MVVADKVPLNLIGTPFPPTAMLVHASAPTFVELDTARLPKFPVPEQTTFAKEPAPEQVRDVHLASYTLVDPFAVRLDVVTFPKASAKKGYERPLNTLKPAPVPCEKTPPPIEVI